MGFHWGLAIILLLLLAIISEIDYKPLKLVSSYNITTMSLLKLGMMGYLSDYRVGLYSEKFTQSVVYDALSVIYVISNYCKIL